MSQMFLNVVSTFKGDGLSAATRQLGAFGSAAGGLGSTLGKVGAALASFGLAAKSIQFAKDSVTEAKNLQQNLFALELVFEKLAPEMKDFARDATKMGLSQAEAAKASVFLGSVMKQSGFGIRDVADRTKTLLSLATDLSLVYQYDVSEALMGMTALFRGEYDPIEKFGVAMKQSEINAELAAQKLDHLTGEQRRLAEQTIRYDMLMQRASDSIGAFAGSTGNLAAESLKLSAEFKTMQATVGTALVPTITDLVIALKPLVEELTPRLVKVLEDSKPALEVFIGLIKDAGDENTTTGATFAFLADGIGEVFRLLADNFGVILQVSLLLGGLRVAFLLVTAAMATTPLGWFVIGVGAAAAGLILVADAAKKAEINNRELNKQWVDNPWQQAVNPAGVYSGILSDVIRKDLEPHTKNIRQIENAWDSAKAAAFDYSAVGRTAATSRPLKGGKQAREFFAAQDLRLNPNLDQDPGPDSKGGASQAPSLSGLPALIAESKKNERVMKKEVKLQGMNLSKEVAQWITSSTTPIKAANQAIKRIAKNGDVAIGRLTARYQSSAAGQQAAAAAFAQAESNRIAQQQENDRIADELRRAEEARIEEQKRVYESFLDSVKNTFAGIKNSIMGAFDITGLGGSTNSVLRNMEKMLVRLRSFSTSVKQLATMGLDPALLQQVISMGPMAGARLASALVQGGAGALGAINAGYGEFGTLASEIARTGTESSFRTTAQERQFTINVNGGVGSGATIGKAIVDAIKDYERTSGAVWQGA